IVHTVGITDTVGTEGTTDMVGTGGASKLVPADLDKEKTAVLRNRTPPVAVNRKRPQGWAKCPNSSPCRGNSAGASSVKQVRLSMSCCSRGGVPSAWGYF